jgi:NADPH2:quinone reductase
MVGGAFGRPALPYIPGFEVAGVVEAVGDGVDVRPGERVWASLGIPGGGFAEYALANEDSLGRMPDRLSFEEAAGLVVGGGTAWDGLLVRGQLQAGETVLITAAAGGVGSAAVQVAAAVGARPLGVASPRNSDYLRGLGASEVFDYHAGDWVQQVLAVVPGGVDVLFDAAGGQTRDQAVGAVRDGGRAIFLVGAPDQLGRVSPAKRSTPKSTGSGWTRSVGWSTRGSCVPRSRRYCPSSRCAKRWNESEVDTHAARSYCRLGR